MPILSCFAPGEWQKTQAPGRKLAPGPLAVYQNTDPLPCSKTWQPRATPGAGWCVHPISPQELAAPSGAQHCSPWQRTACLSLAEGSEVQAAAAYGLVFWISPTNLYSKPAISVVAMETEVLEHNEAHVWTLLPPRSVHHSALLDSKGKQDICAIPAWLWARGLHQAKQPPDHSSCSAGTRAEDTCWEARPGSRKTTLSTPEEKKTKEWLGRNAPWWAVQKR